MTHIFVDEVHAPSTCIDGVRLYLLRLYLLCHASAILTMPRLGYTYYATPPPHQVHERSMESDFLLMVLPDLL